MNKRFEKFAELFNKKPEHRNDLAYELALDDIIKEAGGVRLTDIISDVSEENADYLFEDIGILLEMKTRFGNTDLQQTYNQRAQEYIKRNNGLPLPRLVGQWPIEIRSNFVFDVLKPLRRTLEEADRQLRKSSERLKSHFGRSFTPMSLIVNGGDFGLTPNLFLESAERVFCDAFAKDFLKVTRAFFFVGIDMPIKSAVSNEVQHGFVLPQVFFDEKTDIFEQIRLHRQVERFHDNFHSALVVGLTAIMPPTITVMDQPSIENSHRSAQMYRGWQYTGQRV